MQKIICFFILTMSNLLCFSQFSSAEPIIPKVVWKCPEASSIQVQKAYPDDLNFKWLGILSSNTLEVSIPMQGMNNPQYPTSLKGTFLAENQVLLCQYNTSDEVCIPHVGCQKFGNMLTHIPGDIKPIPLPGKDCHYVLQGQKGWCKGDANDCAVVCY